MPENGFTEIVKFCSDLKQFPMMGMDLAAKTGREADLRYLFREKYIAFYRVEQSQIAVIRILDGRSDYLRMLFDDTEL